MQAGWIFNLDSTESLARYIRDGVYATKIKPPKKKCWSGPMQGTLADYVSMKAGQRIYFFIKRKIYGIGELVNIRGLDDCVFDNFCDASLYDKDLELAGRPEEFYDNHLLYHEADIWQQPTGDGRHFQQRWLCTFKPNPKFYSGIDMDALLKTDKQCSNFRSLRTFSGLSFIKLTPSENALFESFIESNSLDDFVQGGFESGAHERVAQRYKAHNKIALPKLISTYLEGSALRAEMMLEAYILYGLTRNDTTLEQVFGRWSYFSHQVTASPFKPPQYMDKMDIWGCNYIGNDLTKPKQHLLIELKKGPATAADVAQVRKYIDWLKWEHGDDVNDIEVTAFLVAHSFDENIINKSSGINLVKYAANGEQIDFTKVIPTNG